MPKKPQLAVKAADDDQWVVQEVGEAPAKKRYDQKGDAEASATTKARTEGADVVVEDSEGTIERWDQHDEGDEA